MATTAEPAPVVEPAPVNLSHHVKDIMDGQRLALQTKILVREKAREGARADSRLTEEQKKAIFALFD